MTSRPLISVVFVFVLAGCLLRQSAAPVDSKPRIHRLSFIYEPGSDIGPRLTHRIDVDGKSGRYTLRRADRQGVEKEARFAMSDAFRNDIEAAVVGIPAGYWGRKIAYDPEVDGQLVYRMYSDRFAIVAISEAGVRRQIEVDGLDQRLSMIFRKVQTYLPGHTGFAIPRVEFWVPDEEASGVFVWRLVPQR